MKRGLIDEPGDGVSGKPERLTPAESRLIDTFRQLDPVQQRIVWNALRHLASGVPGARLVLAVDR
jgi:hypothetical protein